MSHGSAMQPLVTALCSDECAGRAPGTPGGRLARRHVIEALRDAGLDPYEQPIPPHGGANVLATIPGAIDRWILVAAHYDHLGVIDGQIFRGADDNAAAVAILVEVARGLTRTRPDGRGVILAAFDAEEPPWFTTAGMGSEHFARHPTVPLDRIDLMICMDLVGHAVGPEGTPAAVRDTVFALGAERSLGTPEILEATTTPGLFVRALDAEVIPPLSDYDAFWQRRRPFLLLTNARSRVYHTPADVPAALAWDKMAATARWLEAFTRANCSRPEAPIPFEARRDDASTLRALDAILEALAPTSDQAQMGLVMAKDLRGSLRRGGVLPEARQNELAMLLGALESGLA